MRMGCNRARGSWFVALIVCCAIAASANSVAAQKPDAAAEALAVSNAMNTFYRAAKKPDMGSLVSRWERLPTSDQPAALPPMIGFLSAYFQKNPNEVDRLANQSLTRKGQSVVLIGLEGAGNDAAARRIANKWRWPEGDIAKLASITPLDQLVPESPSDLDTLWGAAFATGDASYVRRIFDFYAKIANDPKIEFGDIVRVVEARRDNKLDSLRGIGERYPPEMAQKIVFAASALWSLMANATVHPFVQAELARLEKEEKETKAVKAMVALKQPR
jgi:hypothetical protein